MAKKTNTYLVILITIVLIISISILSNSLSGFSGTDDKAVDMIHEINPNFKQTTQPLMKQMSPEISSMLFALQAAIGAGILGYYIGYSKGKAKQLRIKN